MKIHQSRLPDHRTIRKPDHLSSPLLVGAGGVGLSESKAQREVHFIKRLPVNTHRVRLQAPADESE